MTAYRVTFSRIGRSHDIQPLLLDADGPNHLAEQVSAYARPFLASRAVEVAVDLSEMTGQILAGFRNAGTFTIATASTDEASA